MRWPYNETDRVEIRPGVHRGLGRHAELYGLEGVKHFYLGLFVCEILYTLTLCLTKFSILLFFVRIFAKTNIRIPVLVLATIVTGWAIAVVCSNTFLRSSKSLLSVARLGFYNDFPMQSRPRLCECNSASHAILFKAIFRNGKY